MYQFANLDGKDETRTDPSLMPWAVYALACGFANDPQLNRIQREKLADTINEQIYKNINILKIPVPPTDALKIFQNEVVFQEGN